MKAGVSFRLIRMLLVLRTRSTDEGKAQFRNPWRSGCVFAAGWFVRGFVPKRSVQSVRALGDAVSLS